MMEIFWTMLASQDRKRIREYIAEQNLMAAIELDERIGYSASGEKCISCVYCIPHRSGHKKVYWMWLKLL